MEAGVVPGEEAVLGDRNPPWVLHGRRAKFYDTGHYSILLNNCETDRRGREEKEPRAKKT